MQIIRSIKLLPVVSKVKRQLGKCFEYLKGIKSDADLYPKMSIQVISSVSLSVRTFEISHLLCTLE